MQANELRGPRPRFILGNLPDFGKDPLGFLERCAREFGDIVPLKFGPVRAYLLNDPAHIEQVLVQHARKFRKTRGYRTPFMQRLFGDGLLTSEGELWTRQRKLAQPAFHRDRIAGYGTTIVQYTQEMVSEWRTSGDSVRNVHRDIMRLTTRVVVRTLFNAEVPPEINDLGNAGEAVMKRFTLQWNYWRLLLGFIPSPAQWKFQQVMKRLDLYIYGVIQARRKSGKDAGDLLSMLLAARDEGGGAMNDRQLRDELTTLMVAGLDTTALALSWALYLLAQNGRVQEQLARECRMVLGERAPAYADLPHLRLAEAVIKETMRLYPSAWIIGREAAVPCAIGPHQLQAGDAVLISQWLKHRDGRYFDEPFCFRPERWLTEQDGLPKFAYFPFGGGPRVCIGNSFAMMEAVLALVTVISRIRVELPSAEYRARPWASITLQPRDGLHLRTFCREPGDRAGAGDQGEIGLQGRIEPSAGGNGI